MAHFENFVTLRGIIYVQSSQPTVAEGAVVGCFWGDTDDGTAYICTSVSPVTFTALAAGSLHDQSHDHSAVGDGQTLAPIVFTPGKAGTATISSGNISVSAFRQEVAPETGGSDNLDTITAGTDGEVILIVPRNDTDTITLRHNQNAAGGDNLLLRDGLNYVMTGFESSILLTYRSDVDTNGAWCEVARSIHSHDHSNSGEGTTLTPATLNIPTAASPSQTAEGQVVWDSDDDELTVGDGSARKTLVNTDRSHDIEAFISAAAMKGTGTGGAGDSNQLPESADSGCQDVNYDYIAFDATSEENAFFQWAIPTGWDEGTITYQVYWTASGGMACESVVFGLKGVALSDDGALDTAFGTEVEVTDAWIANGDVHVTSESGAVTIGNTPAAGDLVFFNLARKVSNCCDDLTGDAQVLGIKLTYTRDSYTD